MHTFMDNFHQSGKYSAQLVSHQAELRREETFPDHNILNISSLQTDYLNFDSDRSGSNRHGERENSVQAKCTFSGGNNHSTDFIFQKDNKGKGESSRG